MRMIGDVEIIAKSDRMMGKLYLEDLGDEVAMCL